MRALLALTLLVLTAIPALAQDPDAEARDIAKSLQCPICQNLSVADSPSELAGQMRDTIKKKLEAGESRDQIMAYFVDRYGEEVLLDPPKRGFTLLVWTGPVLALLVGGIVLALVVARWRRPATSPGGGLSADERAAYAARLQRELGAPEAVEAPR